MTTPEEKLMGAIFGERLGERTYHEIVDGIPLKEALYTAMGKITKSNAPRYNERYLRIFEMRFGLVDGISHTLKEIGQAFNVTQVTIRQNEASSLRRLRHPSISKYLKVYFKDEEKPAEDEEKPAEKEEKPAEKEVPEDVRPAPNKSYLGYRAEEESGVTILIERPGEALIATALEIEPSRKLYNHSSEFSWSYSGSGPAQLALALLLDATGDEQLALSLHQQFKDKVVAGWGDTWSISDEKILAWVKENRGK